MNSNFKNMMIKLLIGILLVLGNTEVAKSNETPEYMMNEMSEPWQSWSLGYEEGFLGAFCKLQQRGVLSRDKLIRLNKEIYEDTMKQAALECQPPSCDIDDFTSIEINYLNGQISEAGCPWLKHPETR